MSVNSGENVFEFLTGSQRVSFTLTQRRYISKIKKLAEKHPDECDYVENKDGSVFGHVPVKWLKVSPPRKMSDEQKEKARERMLEFRRKDSLD